jgi:nicotinate-nucleotide adenylyltransferase
MTAGTDLWRGDRIGVFGMARHARETLGLDRVVFSVAPRPPHKSAVRTSSFDHRFEMVRRAIDGADGLCVTRIEDEHDVSFTVDLLRACRARTRADLYFIIGADSLVELPTWKEPGEILRLATLVVFARDQAALRLEVPGPSALVVFDAPTFEVSSTLVRRRLAAGDDAGALVSATVAEYAATHHLYRDRE